MKISYEKAKNLLMAGETVHAENGRHSSMGGVDCQVACLKELDHYEEGNKDAFGSSYVHYYVSSGGRAGSR